MATKVKIPERYRELYREALEIGPAHIAMTGYDYEITNLIKDVARVEARVEAPTPPRPVPSLGQRRPPRSFIVNQFGINR